MKSLWLNKKNENNKLILFMNGWAMNETAVSNLQFKDYDVLMVNDYSSIEPDFFSNLLSDEALKKYSQKYLVCWSMGVYAANLYCDFLSKFDKKIAINGTTKIIDDEFGIPKRIYKVTVKFLNEDSCDKFIKNMFDNGKINPNIKITKSLDELKNELISIQNFKIEKELAFDKAIISLEDRIIPSKNQIAFWENKTEIQTINSTHCPFECFKFWDELL